MKQEPKEGKQVAAFVTQVYSSRKNDNSPFLRGWVGLTVACEFPNHLSRGFDMTTDDESKYSVGDIVIFERRPLPNSTYWDWQVVEEEDAEAGT